MQPSIHQNNFRRRKNSNNNTTNKRKKKPRQRARKTNTPSHSAIFGDECTPNTDPYELLIGVCNIQALPSSKTGKKNFDLSGFLDDYKFDHFGVVDTGRCWHKLKEEDRVRHHSADVQALNTRLLYDLLRLNRLPAVTPFADLVSNYDLVCHSIASLALQRTGMPRGPIKASAARCTKSSVDLSPHA